MKGSRKASQKATFWAETWGMSTGLEKLDSIWKSRDTTNERPSSQSYGFSNSHVWMWEQDYKESWAPKNRCFWTVVLEKTLEGPLHCKEIKPINPKGNQSWIFIRTDSEAETPVLWPPDMQNWLTGKDPDAGKDWRQKKWMTEDEIVGWHHWLYGHVSLSCCSPRGRKASDRTEQLDWIELNVFTETC